MIILGVSLVIIAGLLLSLSRAFRKTRFLIFGDTSMVLQYILSIAFLIIGVTILYFAGAFN